MNKKRMQIETVNGLIVGEKTIVPIPTEVTVRYTKDGAGETLSLADDRRGVMLIVPFEPLKKMLKGGE